jgi:serine/threonine/tyrosine protein kinase RAD53
MTGVYVPESLPLDSQYAFEATQLSQPQFSQTQNTQYISSQVEPRRNYCQSTQTNSPGEIMLIRVGAILVPVNPQHRILKIPWSRQTMQMGRGPAGPTGNDVVIQEKRVSNRHCKLSLGLQGHGSSIGDGEPDVWIEDLKSSNGTFVSSIHLLPRYSARELIIQVNGDKLKTKRLLRHGDEISLGHHGTLENHDVRYIFRSVGSKGTQYGKSDGKIGNVGEVYEKYQFLAV